MYSLPCSARDHFCARVKCRKCGATIPPSGFKNAGGIDCSARGAQFWQYIQRTRRINLTSFSTAGSVAAVLPQLREALAEAERRAKANPNDWKAKILVADVAALMRRVPEASVDTDAAVKAKAATHQAAGVNAKDVEFE